MFSSTSAQSNDELSVQSSDVESGESSNEKNNDNNNNNNGNNEHSGENSGDLGSLLNDSRSKWVNSVIEYVRGTQVNSLDLKGRNLKKSEAVSILTSLIDSQITEIDLSNNRLWETMKYLTALLAQTKLKKLNVSACRLTNDDLMRLMEGLKDTEITDLDVSNNYIPFDENITDSFVSFLLQSHITNLSVENNSFYGKAGAMFIQNLPKTSLTCLNLSGSMKRMEPRDVITSLFSILPLTSITDLNLSWNLLTHSELEKLSHSLKDSKLEKLNLSCNHLDDAGVNAIMRGLVRSKVHNLNLKCNDIHGKNNLGECLKHSQIKTLNLSHNKIIHDEMFNFPGFLEGSAVCSLYLYRCFLSDEICQKLMKSLALSELKELFVGSNDLQLPSISEFSKILKHTSLTKVNFSANFVPAEMLCALGDTLKESKVKSITLVESDISEGKNALFESLASATLTHVSLAYCKLSPTDVLTLGQALKYTAISHLELEGNHFGDEGLETLVDCLKQTEIVKLNLSENSITSKGAIALANALMYTDLLYVDLGSNKIEDDGFLYLADQINVSFVTVLDVANNCMSSELLITVHQFLWENRRIVQQLIECFKRIAPEVNNNNFQFDRSTDDVDLSALLEDCLFLYKTVVERPSAVNVLAQEQSFSLSKSQITSLMFEEFPRQFATFIARSVEADVAEHVDFLKQVEELGLSSITEFLLLNRPVYVIDENEDILHPYVYTLMHKFKQTIVNLSIEPRGKDKIIDYFTKHKELEGASDIILLLRQSASDPLPKKQKL